jgi:hypothetical protein
MPPESDHWLGEKVDSKEKESRFFSGLTRPDTQFKPLIQIWQCYETGKTNATGG